MTYEAVRLPDGPFDIGDVTIMAPDGRVLAVLTAEEFRRTHPTGCLRHGRLWCVVCGSGDPDGYKPLRRRDRYLVPAA